MASSHQGPLHVEAPLGDLDVGGVGPGAATGGLLEHVLLAHDAADLEVAPDVVLVHEQLDLQVDLGSTAQPRLRGGQPLTQLLQLLHCGGDIAQPPGVLAQREQGAPDPDDGPGLHGWQWRPVDVPAVARPVAVARVGPLPHLGPLGGVGLDPLAELGIFEPAAGHDRDEATARAVDVVHVLARAQLRVGHVEEVAASGHCLERVPGLDVGDGVARVAVGAAKGHGNVPIGAHGEDEQQLLEIGSVRLRVAVVDGRGGALADLAVPWALR